jgi:hypothetical protein
MYFWLADRFSEGHGLLELAVAAASPSGSSPVSRIELLVALTYVAPDAQAGTGAFGVAISGDDEHAATLAEETQAQLEELEDHWAARVRSRLGAGSAALATAEAIAHEPFQIAELLLEGWIAERRDESGHAVASYRQALDIAYRGSGGHRPSLLAPETVRALWSSADARAELARAGDTLAQTDSARALHREVVDWSRARRPLQPRETSVAVPAGSPGAAALTALQSESRRVDDARSPSRLGGSAS